MVEDKMLNCGKADLWGWHLVLNAGCCNDNISNKDAILSFKDELIEKIDMIAFGEPMCERFGEGKLLGITLVQLIRTSNITIHFCDDDKTLYADIFSCKVFDIDVAMSVFQKWFEPQVVEHRFLVRGI